MMGSWFLECNANQIFSWTAVTLSRLYSVHITLQCMDFQIGGTSRTPGPTSYAHVQISERWKHIAYTSKPKKAITNAELSRGSRYKGTQCCLHMRGKFEFMLLAELSRYGVCTVQQNGGTCPFSSHCPPLSIAIPSLYLPILWWGLTL